MFFHVIFLHNCDDSVQNGLKQRLGIRLLDRKWENLYWFIYKKSTKGKHLQSSTKTSKRIQKAHSVETLQSENILYNHHFFRGCRSLLHSNSFDSQAKKMHGARSSLGKERRQHRRQCGIFSNVRDKRQNLPHCIQRH